MLLHKIHAIFILPSIVLAYDLLCPDVSQRQLRSQGLCTRKNDTNTVYTCLEDVNKETYNESCSEKEGAVRPGKKYVYGRLATGRDCSAERYQPILFYKSSGAMCLFLKSTCHEVGQMVAKKYQGLSDTTCICDFTEGYAYVTRPSYPCNCVPSEEDCTCYEKLCPESHLLSADYECIHRNAPSVTICDTIYKSEQKFTTTTTTTVRTDSAGISRKDITLYSVCIGGFASLVLVVLCIVRHKLNIRNRSALLDIKNTRNNVPVVGISIECTEVIYETIDESKLIDPTLEESVPITASSEKSAEDEHSLHNNEYINLYQPMVPDQEKHVYDERSFHDNEYLHPYEPMVPDTEKHVYDERSLHNNEYINPYEPKVPNTEKHVYDVVTHVTADNSWSSESKENDSSCWNPQLQQTVPHSDYQNYFSMQAHFHSAVLSTLDKHAK